MPVPTPPPPSPSAVDPLAIWTSPPLAGRDGVGAALKEPASSVKYLTVCSAEYDSNESLH
jgi:hypothetical protein